MPRFISIPQRTSRQLVDINGSWYLKDDPNVSTSLSRSLHEIDSAGENRSRRTREPIAIDGLLEKRDDFAEPRRRDQILFITAQRNSDLLPEYVPQVLGERLKEDVSIQVDGLLGIVGD
jgi:hypothetical protein